MLAVAIFKFNVKLNYAGYANVGGLLNYYRYMSEINKTEDDWQKELTLEQYQVLRQKGTEAPFSGKYVSANDKGMYVCAACGNKLFASDAKFNAHCGWPSFFQAEAPETIEVKEDLSYNMVRREVLWKKGGGHLGHGFKDGP